MTRDFHRWHSHHLGRDMDLLVFGHAGPPVIVFPSTMGAYSEFEDRGMVRALQHKLEHGWLQLYCVSSVDGESWHARSKPPRQRIERHLQYESYILGDVVPLIRQLNPARGLGVTGCGFGADHAMTMALRHPYTFTSCVSISGGFSLAQFLDGYGDQDSYLLDPSAFLPALTEPYYLDQFRRNKFVLSTGEWDICRKANEAFSGLLGSKGIPHSLHVWGFGSKHDWPYWQPMANAYLP